MSKKLLNLLLVIIMLAVFVPTTLAAPPAQEEGQDYVVVADDWLSKLADKYLGNPLAYPTIVYYTNQKNAEDASYAKITDANLIEVGWKIYIPNAAEAQAYLSPAAAEAAEAVLPDIGPIQFGYMPHTGSAPWYLALEKGYFEEQGLEVELQPFRSGSLMIAPLAAGQLDAGMGEAMGVPLLNAAYQGLPVKGVASVGRQTEDNCLIVILVRKDLFDSGEVTEIADLRGRKVGINKDRTVAQYLVGRMLEKEGLTEDDVELVPVPFPEMSAALANKAVDAAYLQTSFAGKAIADGSAVVFLHAYEIVAPYENGMSYFGERLLDPANREIAVRFMIAQLKATRDLQGDGWKTDEHVDMVLKYVETPREVYLNSGPGYAPPNGELNVAAALDIQDFHISRGHTDFTEPLPIEHIYDGSFVEEALARIGRFEE
jgi:NitT/TauT family transport system substrate-binding protein